MYNYTPIEETKTNTITRTSTNKVLFDIFCRDANSFSIVIRKGLSYLEERETMNRINRFPNLKYDIILKVNYFQATFDDVLYLYSAFSPEEYTIEDSIKQYFTFQSNLHSILEHRLKARLEYDKNYPEINSLNVSLREGKSLLKHQKYALNEMLGIPGFALLCEMGTGKTCISLAEMLGYCQRNPSKIVKGIIVAPNTICDNWVRECEKFIPETTTYSVLRLGLLKDGKDFFNDVCKLIVDPSQLKLVVVNYDRLTNPVILEVIKMFGFDFAYLDESTFIKNPSAKRTKAIIDPESPFVSIPFRRILTGTVNPNNCRDLFAQYEFLYPGMGILGATTFNSFVEKYSESDPRYGSHIADVNQAQLKEKMAMCSIVIRKKNCLDLPEQTWVRRTIQMSKKHREVYEKMVNEFLVEFGDDVSGKSQTEAQYIIVQLLRLAQICCGFTKAKKVLEEGELPSFEHYTDRVEKIEDGFCKIEALEELLEGLDTEAKLIIWHRFKEDAKEIAKVLDKKGISYGFLNGDVKLETRNQNIASFNSDEGIRCIIGQPQTGGVGLTLLGTEKHPCATVIRYSADFSFFYREQSEARCHRIGMFCPVTYFDLVCEDSIDEFMLDRVLQKKENAESLKDLSSLRAALLGK